MTALIAALHLSFWPGAHDWVALLLQNILPLAWVVIVYRAVSSPLQRHERARFFLDVVQSALEQGEPVEAYIVSLSQTRDPALGVKFHLLAAQLESGLTLIPALEKTPGLLPPQLVAMLKTGVEINNFGAILPACRKLLRDGVSQSRAAINYQAVFALVLFSALMGLIPFIQLKVMPVFLDIFSSFGARLPAIVSTASRWVPVLFGLDMLLIAALWLAAAFLLGGPRFTRWLESGIWPVSDWVYARVPWRRKRFQRDFSAMLGLLLDSGLPEERAVALAAASTANRTFVAHGDQVLEQLKNGVKLAEALAVIDDTGEFRWRLANSAHHSINFQRALKGWQESLDARAFQQEQAAAQTISTGMVLLNGGTVFLAVAAVMTAIGSMTTITLQSFP